MSFDRKIHGYTNGRTDGWRERAIERHQQQQYTHANRNTEKYANTHMCKHMRINKDTYTMTQPHIHTETQDTQKHRHTGPDFTTLRPKGLLTAIGIPTKGHIPS